MMLKNRWLSAAAVLFLAVMTAAAVGACKKAETPPPVSEEEVLNIDTLKPILGEARDDVSGVLDVTGDAKELIVTYRYYDVDLKNYDDDMVTEMAPKIQALYKKFKTVDRVVFKLTANDPVTPGLWKPFLNFTITRKIENKLQWSGLLAVDFLKAVEDVERAGTFLPTEK